MIARLVTVSVVLLAGVAVLARGTSVEAVPARASFASLPMALEEWTGRSAEPFDAAILAVLGVDDYVTRYYTNRSHRAPVSLYIGYHASQRQGDAIHSPLNCLPGAGWQPVSNGELLLSVQESARDGHRNVRDIRVNRYVIQKGLDRQVVLYWYQSHGRVVANEYWGKVLLVYDAIRLNRTDAALVRIISPVLPDEPDDTSAEHRASQFARALFPLLGKYLPS